MCILTTNVPVLTCWIVASAREGEQGETEGRRVSRYPDAQQLFVGNVPHDVDKTELKEFFERKWDVTTLVSKCKTHDIVNVIEPADTLNIIRQSHLFLCSN